MKYLLVIFLIGVSCFQYACGDYTQRRHRREAKKHKNLGDDYFSRQKKERGVYFILEIDLEHINHKDMNYRMNYSKKAIEQTLLVLRKHADAFGVAEPSIRREADRRRVIVELTGVEDSSKIRGITRNLRREAAGEFPIGVKIALEGTFLDKAIDEYRAAIHKNPNYAEAYYNLARAYAFKKEKTLSVEFLQKAITLDRRSIELSKKSSDFDNIRESPEFQQLINSVE